MMNSEIVNKKEQEPAGRSSAVVGYTSHRYTRSQHIPRDLHATPRVNVPGEGHLHGKALQLKARPSSYGAKSFCCSLT
jgi:hypothetical protein